VSASDVSEPDAPRYRTVANMIAEALRNQILSGRISTGARLQQNDVAAKFGVSSTPVREAFAELRRQGLIFGTEHRGVRVFRPTLADMVQALEVLELLEGHAIAIAAPLLTEQDLDNSRNLMNEHRLVPIMDWQRRLELDSAFHMSFLVRCPNTKLRDLTEASHRETSVFKLVTSSVEDEELMDTIYDQHAAIMDACAGRDGEKAAATAVAHIRWGRRVITERFG
jgi:DNA-binding GntR family transcriptional regulator